MLGVERGGEEELVLELALPLERARVHELDRHLLTGLGQGAVVHGAEPTLPEEARGREGVRGRAEERIGEAIGRLGVGLGRRALTGHLPEADHEEEQHGEGGGRGGRQGRPQGSVVGAGQRWRRRRSCGDLARRHGPRPNQKSTNESQLKSASTAFVKAEEEEKYASINNQQVSFLSPFLTLCILARILSLSLSPSVLLLLYGLCLF